MLRWIHKVTKRTAIKEAACFIAVFFVSIIFLYGHAGIVHAQGTTVSFGLQPIAQSTALSQQDIRIIIMQVIRAVLGVLGIVALGYALYGGYLIMTSGGNEEKVGEGKKTLVNMAIGIAIILSALAIVQYIINSLQEANGFGSNTVGGGDVSAIQTFANSGALGRIVKDHYPFRDETGVKRNTRISVTFSEPIDPASVMADTNHDGIYGRCVTPTGQTFDWTRDCDLVKPDAVKLFASADTAQTSLPMQGIAVVDSANPNAVTTFVFHPAAALGDDKQKIKYTVDLTDHILKADEARSSAFANENDKQYVWEFETDTTFDFTPPHITGVSPVDATGGVPRNTIVQINFDEAVDPSVVQGTIGANSSFSNIIFGSVAVNGAWRVTNAYKTVEFTSNEACGQNSCGDVIYCLPENNGTCPVDNPNCHFVLVRTAQLLNPGAFQAIPLTGVMDMAGNALDASGTIMAGDGIADGQPAVGSNPHSITNGEKVKDNFTWSFRVNDQIDRTAPYIQTVNPNIDAEGVTGNASVEITFSKPMWFDTLSDINIIEHGLTPEKVPTVVPYPVPFWKRVRAEPLESSRNTMAVVDHREFGPYGADAYYFTAVSSSVKSATQNCLYPGRGPVSDTKDTPKTCVFANDVGTDCVGVVANDSTKDTGCVQTTNPSDDLRLQPNTNDCLNILKRTDISPFQ